MSTTAAGSPETFRWHVGAGMPAYATLAGVRFDRLFLDADAIIDAYRRGQPLARELFGPDVTLGGPLWLGNSYGHINTLGSQLVFPPDSEVGHTPVYGSLEEGIRALGREVDFSRAGLIPRYFELRATLQKAFPQENIPFALHAEGPITTAWLLRGHDFFADLLEAPDEAREYLRRVTESVISFNRFCQRVNGNPELSPTGAGVADDGSAMISPAHWPDLVVPYLERYYSELTTGSRWAHIEDLKIGHLPFLDQLRLNRFDPSVSPALTPAAIRDRSPPIIACPLPCSPCAGNSRS